MRILIFVLALVVASPAAAQTRGTGWVEVGRASYERSDYGRSGPTPRFFAPNSFVKFSTPGPHTYRYASGIRVWYGSVPEFAPVLTNAPVASPQGTPVAAPASPGPRVYRHPSGVSVWYGPGH